MVSRVLVELGKALWGRGLFGNKYHFTEYMYCGEKIWKVSDTGPGRSTEYEKFVSVEIKDMKYFKIICNDRYDNRFSSKDSSDFSELSLKSIA